MPFQQVSISFQNKNTIANSIQFNLVKNVTALSGMYKMHQAWGKITFCVIYSIAVAMVNHKKILSLSESNQSCLSF